MSEPSSAHSCLSHFEKILRAIKSPFPGDVLVKKGVVFKVIYLSAGIVYYTHPLSSDPYKTLSCSEFFWQQTFADLSNSILKNLSKF